ncbi:hypothetical protein LLR47_26615 [Bacillus cereus]|uniref:hypothetical protein n=1 Tax=Bacillus cereus TaxID=1396 RepID=UPI001D142EE2|nr:hypothetical protein [Bacillus cereus]MCC3688757.1 hypothetical protein [Bacillus cereus]
MRAKIKRWLIKEGLLKIEDWACDGLIEKKIAYNMGLNRVILHNWIKKHPIIVQTVCYEEN